MKRIALILSTIIIMSLMAQGGARRAFLIDSLNHQLSKAVNARDSLRLNLDLLDLSAFRDRHDRINEIYELARRTHNLTVQLEMIRRMANRYYESENPDSLLNFCETALDALPENAMHHATEAFIDMMRITANSKILSDSAKRERFHLEVLDYKGDENSTTNEQIRHHYAVMMYINDNSQVMQRTEYIDHLGEMMRKLPVEMESLKNLFLTQASIIYTILGENRRAVTADREMLSVMKQMSDRYNRQGRVYMDYTTNNYTCLRRMLMNYRALMPGEADSIYSQILKAADEMPAVAADLASDGRSKAFYYLAKGRDAEAIPLLQKLISNPKHARYRHLFLRELVDAARRTGDNAVLLQAYPMYIECIEKRYSGDNIRQTFEREMDYKLSDFERSTNEQISQQNERRERMQTILIIAGSVLAIVLLTLTIMLYRLYTSSRRLGSSLKKSNEDLVKERDKLRNSEHELIAARDLATQAMQMKTDFINNMSREVKAPLNAIVEYSQFIVDNMDAGRKHYMENFADIVTLSADLLQTLINDALDTSSLERAEIEINRRPIAVGGICNMAMANIHKRKRPGVELILDINPQNDPIITTDAQRVEQVLINLLSNAAKFTETGSITLSYNFDADHKHITFAVTDTGIGIPEGKEKIIFGRFEKLDSHTQGAGLGLYISSLLAHMLGGTITVDTSYTDGARFLFTIPV